MSARTKAELELDLAFAQAGIDARDQELKALRAKVESYATANATTPEAAALSRCMHAINPLVKWSTQYSTSTTPRRLEPDSRAAIVRVIDHLTAAYLGGA